MAEPRLRRRRRRLPPLDLCKWNRIKFAPRVDERLKRRRTFTHQQSRPAGGPAAVFGATVLAGAAGTLPSSRAARRYADIYIPPIMLKIPRPLTWTRWTYGEGGYLRRREC